jgi:5-methylcytosine-specific restriction endonuclease McrA
MPLRPCLEPGCGQFAVDGKPRCADHAREHNRTRADPRARKVYRSKRWRLTRHAKLGQDPICQRCGERLADEVHHVDGVLGPDPYDISRLESLCARCHGQVGREQQLAFSRG